MAVPMTDRGALLADLGRFYAAERFALIWTQHNRTDEELRREALERARVGNEGDLDEPAREALSDSLGGSKRVVAHGWPQAQPLRDGEYAAGLCGTRGLKANPCVVIRPSGLIAVEADSAEDLAALDALGLPATLSV